MIRKMLNRYRWLKFVIVGGIGVPIHFGILYELTSIGLWYVISLAITIVIATSFNYVLNHYWTFRNEWKSSFMAGLVKYLAISFLFDGIYMGLTILFREFTSLREHTLGYLVAAGIAMGIVMLFRYIIVSKFVWGKQTQGVISG